MKKLFKKILGIGAILILLVNLVSAGSISTPRVLATNQPDECNSVTTYEKTDDFNDSRVSINFENSDEQIDVSAGAGYEITEIWLDVENDNQSGYVKYATGPVNNFNPNPGGDIDKAKVKVKKVCPENKVNICHATSSQSNPWEAIRVDSSAFDGQGQNDHTLHGDFVYSGPVNSQNQQPTNDDWCEDNKPGDKCSNIAGFQASVPAGYTASNNICIEIDVCTNIQGAQLSIPVGYAESNGVCTEIPTDVCPNVDGIQTSTNECPEPTQTDVCPNVDGIQTSTNECPTNEIDVCLNIEGSQVSLPDGYEFEEEGICVLASGQGATPTPTDTPTPTPTSTPTNTGGPGDGLSDGRTESLGGAQSTPASTSQKQGEVLGVSTFAATGDIATDIATIQQALGFAFATFGAVIYGNKKKTSKKTK